jgi:hypothetical protein
MNFGNGACSPRDAKGVGGFAEILRNGQISLHKGSCMTAKQHKRSTIMNFGNGAYSPINSKGSAVLQKCQKRPNLTSQGIMNDSKIAQAIDNHDLLGQF